MDESKFELEDKLLSDDCQENIDELKKMANFFKEFINIHKSEAELYKKNSKKKNDVSTEIHQSILLSSLSGIYDSFQSYLNKTTDIMNKMENELIQPLDFFRSEQLKIYKDNINKMKDINKKYSYYKSKLDVAKFNYYKTSYLVKQNVTNGMSHINFTNDKIGNSLDIFEKNKMIAKNMENIYKYELARYNKILNDINTDYNNTINKIETAEKSRICLIKTSINKYKKFLSEYNNNINTFINVVEKYVSKEVCEKDEKFYINKISQFQKKNGK